MLQKTNYAYNISNNVFVYCAIGVVSRTPDTRSRWPNAVVGAFLWKYITDLYVLGLLDKCIEQQKIFCLNKSLFDISSDKLNKHETSERCPLTTGDNQFNLLNYLQDKPIHEMKSYPSRNICVCSKHTFIQWLCYYTMQCYQEQLSHNAPC